MYWPVTCSNGMKFYLLLSLFNGYHVVLTGNSEIFHYTSKK